jgi:phage-related minor tail protein
MAELGGDFGGDFGGLEAQFASLEGTLAGLQGVTGAFQRELDGVQGSMKATGREASGMSSSVTSSLRRAFEGVIFDGKRLSDALAGIGRSISGSVLNQALAPVQGALGSVVGKGVQSILGGVLPFSKGAAFGAGRVAAFARGGVVDGPTQFPMRSGVGLMGEAGPEAIMPLTRGADGKLGVRAGSGGGAVHVTMNISTPDAAGFQRSQSQIAAEMNRAIQRGRRNL